MTECPQCGNPNVADYCEQCGEFIEDKNHSQQVSLAEKYVAVLYTTKCPQCGSELDLKRKISEGCQNCGAEVQIQDLDKRPGVPNNLSGTIFGVVGSILGAGFGLVLYEGGVPLAVLAILGGELPINPLLELVLSRDAWVIAGALVGGINAWSMGS